MYASIMIANRVRQYIPELHDQPKTQAFKRFVNDHRAGDGRTGYVVMSPQGIVRSELEYYFVTVTHRAEVFAWQGNRVLLRHRDTFAWWTFTGDEMVIVEYDDDAQAGQVAA